MTVAELIAKLQELPQNMPVLVHNPNRARWWIDANLSTWVVAVRYPQTDEFKYDAYQVFATQEDIDNAGGPIDDECTVIDAVIIWG